MRDFVEAQEMEIDNNDNQALARIFKYADFLKQPLTLGMFVPAKLVDGVWVVLEEPNHLDFKLKNSFDELVWKSYFASNNYHKLYDEYQEAKERVLFDGFELKYYSLSNQPYLKKKGNGFSLPYQGFNVESIIAYAEKYRPTLTETAKQQIGL